ncbi:unnamed protein product [Microthlaspi erraticum]|uniref:Uncharacterized protein n=1 Tax=Microthlaspi erraticum TaxID=1685480 RepID=A0A6D2I036_9BRAS|nr:unnamed protein product [Microthlaspi erraticum]
MKKGKDESDSSKARRMKKCIKDYLGFRLGSLNSFLYRRQRAGVRPAPALSHGERCDRHGLQVLKIIEPGLSAPQMLLSVSVRNTNCKTRVLSSAFNFFVHLPAFFLNFEWMGGCAVSCVTCFP